MNGLHQLYFLIKIQFKIVLLNPSEIKRIFEKQEKIKAFCDNTGYVIKRKDRTEKKEIYS
jgi:hypothetical protein